MCELRLYIVTDDHAIGSFPSAINTSVWPKIVTSPADIAALPAGAKCIGIMLSSLKRPSLAHCAWLDRRERGDLDVGLTDEEVDELHAWIGRQGKPSPSAQPSPSPSTQTTSRDPQADARTKPISQRWI